MEAKIYQASGIKHQKLAATNKAQNTEHESRGHNQDILAERRRGRKEDRRIRQTEIGTQIQVDRHRQTDRNKEEKTLHLTHVKELDVCGISLELIPEQR